MFLKHLIPHHVLPGMQTMCLLGLATLFCTPGQGLADTLEAAQTAIRQKHYDEAVALLETYASKPELYPRYTSDYLVALHGAGQREKALSLFESLSAALPRRHYLLLDMAAAYEEAAQYGRALALHKEILRHEPAHTEALCGAAKDLLALGRVQEAEELLLNAQSLWQAYPELEARYALLLMQKRRYGDSLQTFDHLLERFPNKAAAYDAMRGEALRALPPEQQKEALTDLGQRLADGIGNSGEQLLLLLLTLKGPEAAVKALRQYQVQPESLSKDFANKLAWACFTQEEADQALKIYHNLLARYPDFFEAQVGSVYALAKNRQYARAQQTVRQLEGKYQGNLKVLYAKAYVFEQQGLFLEAIRVYDQMLVISPENEVVTRLRIQAYSDMGTPLHALELAAEKRPADKELRHSLQGDHALDMSAWEEPDQAVALYDQIIASPDENKRYLFDKMVALARAQRHEEAIVCYEDYLKRNPDARVPGWVMASLAGSYLYTEKPKQALSLYDEAQKETPASRVVIQGRIDTLIEMRKWREAEKQIDELDDKTPAYVQAGKIRRYSEDQQSLDVGRGWMLMYQNRLHDAETYFQKLYEDAPGNVDIRSARAHLHAWRGWPRLAEEEFNIIHSIDANYKPAYPGHLAVINELGGKEKAREQARLLYEKDPRNKHVQQLVRAFDIEDMRENRFETKYVAEDDGSRDWFVRDEVSAPLSLYTRLYALYFWRKSWNDDLDEIGPDGQHIDAAYFKRAGLGLTHMFNEDWKVRQQFSVDYEEGNEFGSLTELNWTPDDHWRFAGEYDSFSTDIALRARVAGVTAKKIAASARYRESEREEYGVSLSRQLFSDDNDRDEINLGYERDIWNKHDWRLRAFGELYGMRNSGWDDPDVWYYNPRYVWGLSGTLMTEQTVWDAYEQYFAHRLYLTLGVQEQYDYASSVIGAIKYEQEFTFTHLHSLVWNIWYGTNRYDDDRVNSLGIQLIWHWRF